MARCSSCNKFVSLEMQDPEVENLNYDEGHISGDVKISRVCVECNQEMKEASFEIAETIEPFCKCTEPDVKVGEPTVENVEEGGGRYKKSYFGYELNVELTCEKCKATTDFSIKEKIAAGDMDEVG